MNAVLLLGLATIIGASSTDDYYARYDHFDIDELVINLRLMAAYVKCFLGTGPCTPEGADIKKLIPKALQSSCGKCSHKQKILVARVAEAIREKLPEDWKKLNELHNPDGKFDNAIKSFITEYGSQ